jgi:hypothetical protein
VTVLRCVMSVVASVPIAMVQCSLLYFFPASCQVEGEAADRSGVPRPFALNNDVDTLIGVRAYALSKVFSVCPGNAE